MAGETRKRRGPQHLRLPSAQLSAGPRGLYSFVVSVMASSFYALVSMMSDVDASGVCEQVRFDVRHRVPDPRH